MLTLNDFVGNYYVGQNGLSPNWEAVLNNEIERLETVFFYELGEFENEDLKLEFKQPLLLYVYCELLRQLSVQTTAFGQVSLTPAFGKKEINGKIITANNEMCRQLKELQKKYSIDTTNFGIINSFGL